MPPAVTATQMPPPATRVIAGRVVTPMATQAETLAETLVQIPAEALAVTPVPVTPVPQAHQTAAGQAPARQLAGPAQAHPPETVAQTQMPVAPELLPDANLL